MENLHPASIPYVQRDNITAALEGMFESGGNVVVVEGFGKSTVLQQYADTHQATCLLIGVEGGRKLGHTPESMLADFVGGVESLAGHSSKDESAPTEENARRSVSALVRRSSRRSGGAFRILLDGFAGLSGDDLVLRDMMHRILPWGSRALRIAMTHQPPEGVRSRQLTIPPLSLREVHELLAPLGLTEDQVRQVHSSSGGDPGQVVGAASRLQAHVRFDDVIAELAAASSSAELLWNSTQTTSEPLRSTLSLVAFAQSELNAATIAEILGADAGETAAIIANCPLLASASNGSVSFSSPALLAHAKVVLAGTRKLAGGRLAEHALRAGSRGDLVNLPLYLRDAGRSDAIGTTLTVSYFEQLIRDTGSLDLVARRAEIALESARERSDQLRMLEVTLVAQISYSSGALELLADCVPLLHSMGRDDEAARLASTASRPEQRLRMFAALAASRRRHAITPQDEIEQLGELSESVDLRLVGSAFPAIVGDLLIVAPEIATRLLERWAESGLGAADRDDYDRSFAEILVQYNSASTPNVAVDDTVGARLREHIADPRTRYAADATWRILRSQSAESALRESHAFASAEDRLRFLRQWITIHAANPSAVDVAVAAMTLAIQTSSFTITPQFLRDVSAPLASVPRSTAASEELDALIRTQGVLGGDGSATVPHLQTRGSLAAHKVACRAADGIYDFLEVLMDAEALEAIDDRLPAIAHLLAMLHQIPLDGRGPDVAEVLTTTEEALERALQRLLNVAALQADAVGPLVRHCIHVDAALAVRVLGAIRNRRHREAAVLSLASFCRETAVRPADAQHIARLPSMVSDASLADRVRAHVVGALWAIPDVEMTEQVREAAAALAEEARRAADPLAASLCAALRARYECVRNGPPTEDPRSGEFAELLGRADGRLSRVIATIAVGGALADSAPWRTTIEKLVGEQMTDDGLFGVDTERRYWAALDLYIRAGYHPAATEVPAIDAAAALIEMCESVSEQLAAWSNVAIRLFLRGEHAESRALVVGHVSRLMAAVATSDGRAFRASSALALAAQYLVQPHVAEEQIARQQSAPFRSFLWYQVALLRLGGVAALDALPVDCYPRDPIDYDQALEVLGIVERVDDESRVHTLLRLLSHRSQAGYGLTREQRRQLAERMRALGQRLGVDQDGVGHEGYLILVDAIALSMESGRQEPAWRDLFARARALRPLADSCLVLTMISEHCPPGMRESLLEEALACAGQLEVASDRISRFRLIGVFANGVSRRVGRTALERAVELSIGTGSADDSTTETFDRLHRLDPDAAERLVERLDSDHARVAARLQAHVRAAAKFSPRPESETSEAIDAGEFAALCAIAARRHAEVLVGRQPRASRRECEELIEHCMRFDLLKAHPVLKYVIESLAGSFATHETTQRWRSFVEGLGTSVRLVRVVAHFSPGMVRSAPDVRADVAQRRVFSDGDGEIAHAEIRNWIERHCSRQLVVVDPYFSIDDLEFIARSDLRDADVAVLAGKRMLAELSEYHADLREALELAWSRRYALETAPHLELIVVIAGDKTPYHDRWWLGDQSGLRVGTSPSGLGSRIAEISPMTAVEAAEARRAIEPFLRKTRTSHAGVRVKYHVAIL